MSEKELVKISEAEWEVMRVVWTKKVTTSPEIIAILSGKMAWKPATIKTLIGRLVKKEMLSTEQVGKGFLYRPLISEEDVFKEATAELFGHLCAKRVGATIAQLIHDNPLAVSDLALIQTALTAKESLALESIPCNCVPGQCRCHEH